MPGLDASSLWYYQHSQGFFNWHAAVSADDDEAFLLFAAQQTQANQPPIPWYTRPGMFIDARQHQPGIHQHAEGLVDPVLGMEMPEAVIEHLEEVTDQSDPDNEEVPVPLATPQRHGDGIIAGFTPLIDSPQRESTPALETEDVSRQISTPGNPPGSSPSEASPSFESARDTPCSAHPENDSGTGEGSSDGAFLMEPGIRPLDTQDISDMLLKCERLKTKVLSLSKGSSKSSDEGSDGFGPRTQEELDKTAKFMQQMEELIEANQPPPPKGVEPFAIARIPKTDRQPKVPVGQAPVSRMAGRINDAFGQAARETFGRPASTSTPLSGQDCPVCAGSPTQWLKYSPQSRQGLKCTCPRIQPLVPTCKRCGKASTSPSCTCIVTRSHGGSPEGHWDRRTMKFVRDKKREAD